ncbi:MAG: hypothetical protein L7V86_03230 [Verrucomicrobiales bacterium]|nr:hypothetical protein [Verrucomicrobiales bacterium]
MDRDFPEQPLPDEEREWTLTSARDGTASTMGAPRVQTVTEVKRSQ